jgi:hypothetical protein
LADNGPSLMRLHRRVHPTTPALAGRAAARRHCGNPAQRIDKSGPAALWEHFEEHPVDLGGAGPEGREQRFALVRQSQNIRARIVARSTAGEQALAHEAANEIGRRRPVDARCLHEANLIRTLALCYDHKDRKLAWGQTGVRESCGKSLVCGLLRPMQ